LIVNHQLLRKSVDWRLAIVLSIGTALQVAWLFVPFRGVEAGYADAGLIDELLDFTPPSPC